MRTSKEMRNLKSKMRRDMSPAIRAIADHYRAIYSEFELKECCIVGSYVVELIIIPKMLVVIGKREDGNERAFLSHCGFVSVVEIPNAYPSSIDGIVRSIDAAGTIMNSQARLRSALGRANAIRGNILQRVGNCDNRDDVPTLFDGGS